MTHSISNQRTQDQLKPGHKQPRAQSKLSLGPKNPRHRTYCRNEKSINKALCHKISDRRIDIKARELYREAGITSPTFYLHYHNPEDALLSYEAKLQRELYARMHSAPSKKEFYSVLARFIRQNQDYFSAVAKGEDYHFLKQVLSSHREALVGDNTSDHNFEAYIGVSISIINYWMTQDQANLPSVDLYAERLTKVRPIRWW